MLIEQGTDTNTPAASSQAILRRGALHSAFGTAVMALGTLTGAQGQTPDLMPTSDFTIMSDEDMGGTLVMNGSLPTVDTPLPSPGTGGITHEFQSQLDAVLENLPSTHAVEPHDNEALPEGRLVHPTEEEYTIRVQFRVIDEELPRIPSDLENG